MAIAFFMTRLFVYGTLMAEEVRACVLNVRADCVSKCANARASVRMRVRVQASVVSSHFRCSLRCWAGGCHSVSLLTSMDLHATASKSSAIQRPCAA